MTASADLLRRARRRRIVAAVALTGVASLGTAWVWSIDIRPANAPAVARHGNAAGAANPAQTTSGTLRVGVEQAAGLASTQPASAARDDTPGSAADTECRTGITVLTRLRAAAARLLPHDGLLVPLIGRIERAEDEAARAGAALHAAAVARLRSSAVPLQRAAGLAIAALLRPVLVAALPEPAEKGAAAQPEAAASQPPDALPASTQALAELALLARDSAEPRIYAWAWTACARVPPGEDLPAACSQLSAQRWAQLAPDQAAPWLALAMQAQRSGDVAGEWNAMHRAALATQWRPVASGLLSLLLAAQSAGPPLPPSTPLHDQVRWNAELHALLAYHQANDPLAPRFCLQPPLLPPQQADANRLALCASMAERMLAQADDLLHFSLALGVARRLDWPAERLARWQSEFERLRAADGGLDALKRTGSADARTACSGIRALRQRIARIAADGELAVLRAEVQAAVAVPPHPAVQ